MQKRVMIFLFVLSLLVPSVLAATTVTDSAVITSGEVIGALNWSNLQSYPTPCAAGTYLTAVNDTMTCTGAIAAYTNIVLSNSTLMNTTILQLTSNLSGGSGVANYNNILLSNQSTVLTQSFIINSPGTFSAPSNSNISDFRFLNVGAGGPHVITLFSNDNIKINSSNSNSRLDLSDLGGVHYGYKQSYAWIAENLNPVLACNTTNYGQIIFPQSQGVLSYCAGNGWRNITDSTSGSVSYGTSISSSQPSILDGGSQGFSLTNSNQSAETFFGVSSGQNKATVNIITVGDNNALFPAMIGPSGGSAILILDGPRKALISNTLGQNLTFNIGDSAGGLNATDQLLIGIDRVQLSPNILLTLQVNTTPIACNAANKGAIIFSTKHMGCDGTNWNFLY